MLKGRDNIYFKNKNINDKGVIFFIQRWLELFEQKTISSYQFYITNVIVGLYELIEVIDKTLDGSFNTIDNYDACRLELLRTVKNDSILDKYMFGVSNRLKSHLDVKVKKDDRSNLLRLRNGLSYLLKKIELDYEDYLMKELLESIKSNNCNDIQKHIKSLSSQCIHKGWTPNGASRLIEEVFLSDDFHSKEFNIDNLWEIFKTRLEENIEFEAYLRIDFSKKGSKVSDDELVSLIKLLGIDIADTAYK